MDNLSCLSSSNPLYSYQKEILASSLLQKEKEHEGHLEEEEDEEEEKEGERRRASLPRAAGLSEDDEEEANLLQGQEGYEEERVTTDEEEELFQREEEEEERDGTFSSVIKSVEHTFLENVVFYLFLGSVPGWLHSFFSYLLLYLFPSSPSFQKEFKESTLVGCLCFIFSLKLYGILLSRGAITDPCGVFLRLTLLKDLHRIKKDEEDREETEEEDQRESNKMKIKELKIDKSEEEKEISSSFFSIFLQLSFASLCAAILVGFLRRLSFSSSSSSSSSSIAFQVYNKETSFLREHDDDVTRLSSPLDLLLSPTSSSSLSFFLSVYSLLPEFIQITLTSVLRTFLLSLCHILVFLHSFIHLSFVSLVSLGVSVASLGASIVSAGVSIVSFFRVPILSSSAFVAKLQSLAPLPSLHEVSQSASVSSFSSTLSMLFGGKRGDGGLIDVVENRFGSVSQVPDFEMLLWVNGMINVFLGECIFACINYMVQGVDFLINEILSMNAEEDGEEKEKKKKREKRILLISGIGDLSLILGAMIYMSGSPYCLHT
ncbi:transmembrane protein, partial [Cystoisospora suis]